MISKSVIIGGGVVVLLVLAGSWWWRGQVRLPTGDTRSETIVVEDGQVVDEVVPDIDVSDRVTSANDLSGNRVTKDILITDGVRHSVPLDEIVGGGPPKDGIPSIDNPKFLTISEVDFLDDDEPGIAVSLNGIDRFYPFQILVWHEIVNDNFPASAKATADKGGQRVLVTYCPLCLSGIVFEPEVDGETVEFGTSGKLWDSNLVMYDRKTDSLWSQILGESIVGEMTGTELEVLPSDQMRYGEWKGLNLAGQVLSKDTGATRFYGRDPYGDYYADNSALLFSSGSGDDRLENKDFVLGLVLPDPDNPNEELAKAYFPPAIKAQGEVVDKFAGKTIVARYEADIDAVRLFERLANGKLERINPIPNFWFSWVGAYPNTAVLK